MRKLITAIAIVLLIAASVITCSAENTYKYAIDDYIPRDAQKKAADYIISPDADVIDSEKVNYSSILDKYLNYFGIYCPEGSKNTGTVFWLQNLLIEEDRRVTFIPERYSTVSDLTGWVERFAEPGDLLLFKANGKPDKCTVYLGSDKMLGLNNFGKGAIVPIRATMISDQRNRTRSSGLYAIAHIWKEEILEEEKYLTVEVSTETDENQFSQEHFIVWERNLNTQGYTRSGEFIIFERKPGRFEFWNGRNAGFDEEYIRSNDGIHLQLTGSEDNKGQICKVTKIDIDYEEAKAALQEQEPIEIRIETTESQNMFQWEGKDLLQSISEKR